MSKSIYLVQGRDEHLVGEELERLRRELVGDRVADLVVTEFEGEEALERLLLAARTPAFVDGRRVLVSRLGQLTKDSAEKLTAYLEDPSPDAVLLIAVEGRLPASLQARVKASGELTVATAPPPQKRTEFVASRARSAGLSLTGSAAAEIAASLGDQVTSVGRTLEKLKAAYPEGGRLDVEEVLPHLGKVRRGASWDLTDAIDRGNAESALGFLDGSLAEGMHPLQILAALHNHFRRLARLAGRGLDADRASAELGIKRYPAEKALAQATKLGESGIERAMRLLADADSELKGASALDTRILLEVLVIRLSSLSDPVGQLR